MARVPYTNFPFPFYRNYSRLQSTSYNFPQSHINNNSSFPNYSSESNFSNYQPQNNFSTDLAENENYRNLKSKNKSNKNDDYLFDLFGLKIYSDDVLLVSLIYFLYSEGVKDDGLFIVLVLLLLS